MARGQRKTIEEKISAKQELIEALTTRMESEKRELNDLSTNLNFLVNNILLFKN